MNITSNIVAKGNVLDGRYTSLFFIKKGEYAETYRMRDDSGRNYFVKLIDCSKVHRTNFDADLDLLELKLTKGLNHRNVVTLHDSGEILIQSQKYIYLVFDFISGETLAEKLKREHTLKVFDAKNIVCDILEGLDYLHNLSEPIVHNEITTQNVMLDLSRDKPLSKLIDFGRARYFRQSSKSYRKEGVNPFYLAPECFNGVFSPQSDLFSVGALLHHILFGLPPWFIDISDYKKNSRGLEEEILRMRTKPLKSLDVDGVGQLELDGPLLNITKKALHPDTGTRFLNAREFLQAIRGEISVPQVDLNISATSDGLGKPQHKGFTSNTEHKGFALIAGMQEIKDALYNDVIRVFNEKDLYEEYGLSIPNGILLYGPPGCGKTFFAQRLSEEVGFNFVFIRPSDLASIYVHGAQEKIGQLFAEARANAPTILFIDELDALIPARTHDLYHSYASETNEFLAQLTGCSKDGVLFIGATNRPDRLDPALLRAGRVDKIFYVPPPDRVARSALFRLSLESRPVEFGINYDVLAQATENYVSSDIELLVTESARTALQKKCKISQEILLSTIKTTKPSVPLFELQRYEEMRKALQGEESVKKRGPMGFTR